MSDYPLVNIIELIIIFLAVFLLFIVVTNNLQWIGEILGPLVGGGGAVSAYDTSVASHSSDALVCAINAVASGDNTCADAYKKPSAFTANIISGWVSGKGPGMIADNGLTGFASSDNPFSVVGGGKGEENVDIATTDQSWVECSTKTSVQGESPVIEYEEGGGVWGIGGWDNVCYKYVGNTGWMWRFCKNKDFNEISSDLGEKTTGVHYYMQKALKDANSKPNGYEEGLKVFAYALDITNSGSIDLGDNVVDNVYDDEIRVIRTGGSKTDWHGYNNDLYVDMTEIGKQIISSGEQTSVNLAVLMDYKPGESKKSDVCIVKGFYLPQKITGSFEKYIAGYGDPQYLMYWQNFPAGEDAAWTSYATWLENVGTVVLFALPVGKILKGGKYLITGTEATVKATASTALTSAGTGLWNAIKSKFVGKQVQLVLFETGLTKSQRLSAWVAAAGKGMFKELIWGAEKHYGPKLSTLVAVAGVSTTVAWVAAYMDSLNDKYEKIPEKMVLKTPYKEPKTFDVSKLTKSPEDTLFGFSKPLGIVYPVILERTGISEASSTFYLASPCHADLRVELGGETYCKEYIFNYKDKTAICEPVDKTTALCLGDPICSKNPLAKTDIPEEQIPQCGEFDISMKTLENNKLFDNKGNDGAWHKVTLSNLILPQKIDALNIIDADNDKKFEGYEIISGSKIIKSSGSAMSKYGEIDTNGDGSPELDFSTIRTVDDKIKLYVYEKGAKDPICESTSDGGNLYDEYVFYAGYPNDGTTWTSIGAIKYADVSEDKKTCHLETIIVGSTLNIMDTNRNGNIDTVTFGSRRLQDNDGDGSWDYYDPDTNDIYKDAFTYDKEFSSIMMEWCKTDSVTVSVENKDKYNDEYNFCYSKPQVWKQAAIFAGSIVVSAVLEYASAGLLTQVAVGVMMGGMYVASQQEEKWPGPQR